MVRKPPWAKFTILSTPRMMRSPDATANKIAALVMMSKMSAVMPISATLRCCRRAEQASSGRQVTRARLAPLADLRNRLRQRSRHSGPRCCGGHHEALAFTQSELWALLARTHIRKALHDLYRAVSLHLPE